MSSEDEQIQQRRANLEELVKLGVEAYPRRFDRRHTISELVTQYGARSHDELEADRIETRTSGRIMAIRSFGKANFLVLSDGLSRIQVYIRQDSLPPLVEIGLGSPVGVTFGYRTAFPAQYQRAFFVADNNYGRIIAVHIKPAGSG